MSNTRIGLIRCEHCGRQFNPHAGARHIPWCAKQKSEQRKCRLTADKKQALERYKWRINYRPSNQILHPPKSTAINNGDKRFINLRTSDSNEAGSLRKKSSLNSISLSSHSASSTNSIGTNSLLSTTNGHARRGTGNNNNNNKLNQSPNLGALKRSISSVTLTKQRESSVNDRDAAHDNPSSSSSSFHSKMALMRQRAKSHSDLVNVSEIVETLAKRMDEIFAQNQILLASMSKRGPTGHLSLSTQFNNNSDNEEETCSNNSREAVTLCHHCKSECLESANYCHKCGCKVARSSTTFSTSSPTTTG